MKTVIPPGIASSSLALSVNLCYKLERRRNPYASEFKVAVKWELTDVSKAFNDRNLLQCGKLCKKNLSAQYVDGLRGMGLVPYKKERSATVLNSIGESAALTRRTFGVRVPEDRL